MAIVNVVQVRKEFAERVLFSDISFEIGPRDHIGLIGVNGCGKSTLIQMIEGRLRPDGGFIAFLHARAHDGEANKALLELISDEFKVPKTQIEIVAGAKSRDKIIEM